jgi:hypothetical protein
MSVSFDRERCLTGPVCPDAHRLRPRRGGLLLCRWDGCWSCGCGQGGDPLPAGDEGVLPAPVAADFQGAAAGVADQPGRHVPQPVTSLNYGDYLYLLFSGRFPEPCRIAVSSRSMLRSSRPVTASRRSAGMPAARLADIGSPWFEPAQPDVLGPGVLHPDLPELRGFITLAPQVPRPRNKAVLDSKTRMAGESLARSGGEHAENRQVRES